MAVMQHTTQYFLKICTKVYDMIRHVVIILPIQRVASWLVSGTHKNR